MPSEDQEDTGVEWGTADSVGRRHVLRRGMAGVAVLGGTALAGCLGDDEGNGNDGGNGDSGDGGNGDGGDGETTNVAIISSPAGFGDQSFNDAAMSGLEEATQDMNVEVNDIEATEEGEYESIQADTAESGNEDLIVMVGDQHTDPLATNAEQYEDQLWMLINDHVESPHDNVSGWIEMNNEMSFLAGVAAGTLTQEEVEHEDSETDPDEGIVGFAGGEDIDLINAFEESYIQGVEWVDEGLEVLTGYGGSFSDPSGVNDVAESQFDDGADIVWHAASAAGAGAFEAAQDNGRFALGVDDDQSVTSEEYANVILGSAIKDLGAATYEVAQAVHEDNWESVAGEQNLTTEDGGIDFVVGQEFEGELPDTLDTNIEDAKDAIIEGEIDFICGPTGC